MAVVVLLATQVTPTRVVGTIAASETGRPVAGALVEAVEVRQRAWSDSAGNYAIELPAGAHTLRVSRPGFDARTLEVLVAPGRELRIDIALVVRPPRLAPVLVTARPGDGSTLPAPGADSGRWIGSRRYAAAAIRDEPSMGEADVLRVLATAPDVAVSPETPTAIRVRGGSADQNLVLLDGLPLYNPYHGAGTLAAINPDAVAGVTMHVASPPPRFGDALSSVIEIETRDPASPRWSLRGAVTPSSLRQTLSGPLPVGAGGWMISGRSGGPRSLARMNQTASGARFADVLATASMVWRRGELKLLSFTARDALAFDASAERVEGGGGAEYAPEPPGLNRNAIEWSTSTRGLVWRGAPGPHGRLDARVWRTQFASAFDWADSAAALRLTSGLADVGAAAELTRQVRSTEVSTGLMAQRRTVRYLVSRDGVAADSLLTRTSTALLVSPFVSGRWRPELHWELDAGLRTSFASGVGTVAEPRLATRFSSRGGSSVSIAYAVMHQQLQSLRNEESLVDAITGVALPVASGATASPLARAEQLAVTTQSRLNGATITLEAYARRLDGLVLAAPVTAAPFATDGYAVGDGSVVGGSAQVARSWAAGTARVSYGIARVRRTAQQSGQESRYAPSFPATQSLSAAVAYRWPAFATLRMALWAMSGRPASLVMGNLDWNPHEIARGAGDIAGTPRRIAGGLNNERLPPYLRLDVGIRRVQPVSLLGRTFTVTGVATLANALGRVNVAGLVVPDSGTRRVLASLPRTLTLGVEWAF